MKRILVRCFYVLVLGLTLASSHLMLRLKPGPLQLISVRALTHIP